VENAKEKLKKENIDWDFNHIQADAESNGIVIWEKYRLQVPIRIVKHNFTPICIILFIHPNVCSDVDGEYMGADFKVHSSTTKHYTSFSNWDTYRTQIQLLSILDPDVASDVVISLQLFAEQSGGAYPKWVMANIETGIMQGDPTPILISNAYAFGARIMIQSLSSN